jgi:hypothetical protein
MDDNWTFTDISVVKDADKDQITLLQEAEKGDR